MIIFDDAKRLANLDKHGLDFASFEQGFDFETALAAPARASRTGRARLKLIGLLDGEIVVAAIVSPLGTEGLSLVSLRRADHRERKAHDDHQA